MSRARFIHMTNNDVPRIGQESYGIDLLYATSNLAIGQAIVDATARKNIIVNLDDAKAPGMPNQW